MKVRYLPLAESEIDEAFQWYEDQRVGLGYEFLAEFNRTIDRVVVYPEAYTVIEEGLHRALVKRFPYGIIYGVDGEGECIVIVAVSHLHREPFYWME